MRSMTLQTSSTIEWATLLTRVGTGFARYGLVLVFLFIGGLKFTHGEAGGNPTPRFP
jgi:uncharacterized membrane protein YkgB